MMHWSVKSNSKILGSYCLLCNLVCIALCHMGWDKIQC